MASPIFDPKNRPKSPDSLGSTDIGKLHARSNPVVVSVDNAAGIFLHAAKCVEEGRPCRLPRVPDEWKKEPPRVYVVPLDRPATIKNGNQTTTIERLKETIDAIKDAFRAIGCEIEEGMPSRFDRRDVI